MLNLKPQQLISLDINENIIDEIEDSLIVHDNSIKEININLNSEEESLLKQKSSLSEKLNAPQQAFQEYKEQLKIWEDKIISLQGYKDEPDTLEGLKHRKNILDTLPNQRLQLMEQRLSLANQILLILNEQKANREALFEPVQSLIQNNSLIRDEYKLQFMAELSCTADQIITNYFLSLRKPLESLEVSRKVYQLLKTL